MPKNESVIQFARIEKYFATEFPQHVGDDYLKDFDKYPADVLALAVDKILEESSHLNRPPTRSAVKEKIQRIHESRWQERKKKSPTLADAQRAHPPEIREMVRELTAMISRLFLKDGDEQKITADDLLQFMGEMSDKYPDTRWQEERKKLSGSLVAFRKMPSLKRGNLHPLQHVDAALRPEVYGNKS